MRFVETVCGPVTVESLGITLAHEHLRTRNETVYTQFPHLYDDEAAASPMVSALSEARSKGLGAYCDQGVAGLGRDVRLMQDVSRRSGVHVLCGTGYYTFDALPPFFAGRSIDVMAAAFVHDLTVGIQGTEAKAAYLKCATDAPGITRGVEKVLRACARAHRSTGAPIVTHSVPALGTGLSQLDVFADEGATLSSVMIGHCGDSDDLGYLEQVITRGAMLGMDRFGMDDRLPHPARIETIVELWKRGHGDRLIISHDRSIVADIVYEPHVAELRKGASTSLIFDRVLPALADAGMPDAEALALLTTNPHRWLAGAG